MEGLRIALRTRVYPWFMVVLGFLMFYLLALGSGKVFGQEPDTKQGAIFEQGQVRGQGTNKWQFSIVMESTAQGAWVPGYGGDEKGTFGFEQYGNLRLEAPLNRWGKVYVAGNVLAASGSSLERGATTSTGQGYGSIVELERLYYRLETESSDWETGLLRIPFGFGQAFRPTDFLNPPNPLNPDARPRGVLGTVYTLYPTDSILFRVYASLGKDPKQTDVAGASAGISGELHVPSSSIQGMYVFQAPEAGEQRPNHRMGLSFKWDGDVALTLDALYTLWGDSLATNQWYDRSWHPALGLQAAAGLDASLGSFIFLLQYFYNGGGPLNPKDSLAKLYEPSMGDWKSLPPNQRIVRSDVPIGDWNRRNYLHSSLLYKVDDYTRFTLSSTMNLDDGSFVPAISFEHEPFQGFSLQGTLRVFLDSHVWGLGPAGELGPLHTGKRADCTVKGRIRL